MVIMMTIYIGLAQSLNMINNLRENTFDKEVEITKAEFLTYCKKATSTDENVINVAGHDNNPFGLPQALNEDGTRYSAKLHLGDELIWAQFVGARRNEDGSVVDENDEEYMFFKTKVVVR